MRKVILIGRFNDITKEISESLSAHCHVQLCPDIEDSIKGMLKIINPDLVFVALPGVTLPRRNIFSILERNYANIPVIVLGSKSDQDRLAEDGYLSRELVKFLRRPIKMEEITQSTIQHMATWSRTYAPVQSSIPQRPMQASAPQQSNTQQSNTQGEKRPTILVVDDSPMVLRAVQSMLSNTYRAVFATSGPQALAVIAKGRPDLILLDYDMPVCNGAMTMQMLRSEDSTKDIPIVFLTGMADADHVQEILALRPDGYLLKPPSEEKLFATINRVLAASWKAGNNG